VQESAIESTDYLAGLFSCSETTPLETDLPDWNILHEQFRKASACTDRATKDSCQ